MCERKDLRNRRPTRGLFTCVVVVSLIGAACQKDEDTRDADETPREQPQEIDDPLAEQRKRYDDLDRDDARVETFDLDRDGEPDQWHIYNEDGRLVRIERDLNYDGRIDQWQYPDAEGNIIEEESNLDLDEKVDVVTYYDTNGTVTRKELALDFTGEFSIEKFYDKKGELLRVERDEDGDGQADIWEYFDQGNRVRIGWDENDDGVPDRFDNLR